MQVSLQSVLEDLVSFFGRVPTPILYALLTLLLALSFVAGSAFNGWGWIAILIAAVLSDLIGPAGAGGVLLYLYVIGCIVGVINIIGFNTMTY